MCKRGQRNHKPKSKLKPDCLRPSRLFAARPRTTTTTSSSSTTRLSLRRDQQFLQNGRSQSSDHQPDDHPGYDAGVEAYPLRRPQRAHGRSRPLHRQQRRDCPHLPVHPVADQQEEGHDDPQVRRAGAHGLLGGGQARHHDGPSLRPAAAAHRLPRPAHGHRHDGLHAPVHEVHEPPAHPEHHPPQERPRDQPGQDLPLRPARRRRPQAALQAARRLHERHAGWRGPERQEGCRGRREDGPRRRQGGVEAIHVFISHHAGRSYTEHLQRGFENSVRGHVKIG